MTEFDIKPVEVICRYLERDLEDLSRIKFNYIYTV